MYDYGGTEEDYSGAIPENGSHGEDHYEEKIERFDREDFEEYRHEAGAGGEDAAGGVQVGRSQEVLVS